MSRKSDLRKLKRYEEELFDGSSDVSSINRDVTKLQDEFEDLVNSNNIRGIISKIRKLTEPALESDDIIDEASRCLRQEIAALTRDIEAEEKIKKAAAEAKAAINGA